LKGKRPTEQSEASSQGLSERTMMISTADISRPPKQSGAVKPPPLPRPNASERVSTGRMPTVSQRNWQPFEFASLERVSKRQTELLKRVSWLIPGATSTEAAAELVVTRLKDMLEASVSLSYRTTEMVSGSKLSRYVAEPTFLAVLSPLPNKTRGLLEIELSLAHQMIDSLLGGSGEVVAMRPLTEIEEGVITYVAIEALKALGPSLDSDMPKLRIETLAASLSEAAALIPEDESVAVVQFEMQFGEHSGPLRVFIPETVLEQATPPASAEIRGARLQANLDANKSRLSHVKTTMRAEIGAVEIQAADLDGIRPGDVVLVESLSSRPDKNTGGTAKLRVGLGRSGALQAEVAFKNGKFFAKVTALVEGPPEQPGALAASENAAQGDDESDSAEQGGEETGAQEADEADESEAAAPDDDFQGSDFMAESEGQSLVNDIPLQMTVELGRVTLTGEEVVALRVGQIFDLNKLSGEPLDLSINGKVIGRGEVVEVDGNLGIRVVDLS
jgi:type III secretion system YscQ/HrcQ family protein